MTTPAPAPAPAGALIVLYLACVECDARWRPTADEASAASARCATCRRRAALLAAGPRWRLLDGPPANDERPASMPEAPPAWLPVLLAELPGVVAEAAAQLVRDLSAPEVEA